MRIQKKHRLLVVYVAVVLAFATAAAFGGHSWSRVKVVYKEGSVCDNTHAIAGCLRTRIGLPAAVSLSCRQLRPSRYICDAHAPATVSSAAICALFDLTIDRNGQMHQRGEVTETCA